MGLNGGIGERAKHPKTSVVPRATNNCGHLDTLVGMATQRHSKNGRVSKIKSATRLSVFKRA